MDLERKWMYQRLRRRGFRLTFPRRIILEALDRAKHHMSADEIYVALHKKYPQVGLTTVYRTLELLAKLKLINKFDFGDGRFRYELKDEEEGHHHHLVCRRCGKVVDYKDFIKEETDLVERIGERLSKKYSFNIESHQVRFYGLCKECTSREEMVS
jgi:Fur family ferric uptake transcriptional regulator